MHGRRGDDRGSSVITRGGSVHAANSGNTAYLNVFEGQAKLNWNWDDNSNPQYGGAFRRVCRTEISSEFSRGIFHTLFLHPPSILPVVFIFSASAA